MCGIVGYIGHKVEGVLSAMSKTLEHRGPDSQGLASYLADTVHLAHQRLAILDLSPQGSQPMISRNGKWSIVFNGEIYNFRSLRAGLAGPWSGESDTEVLLESISQLGIEKTLKQIKGMFAFAALDLENKKLFLVRDRAGEKPLCYYQSNDLFAFSSEVSSLRRHPGFREQISQSGLAEYFIRGYVPAPLSIYENVFKVRPGHFLVWDIEKKTKQEWAYWNPNIAHGDVVDPIAQLDSLLTTVVDEQMVSDVPLGAFLSGGIDSSLVVAFMQKLSSKPIHTFAIGFDDPKLNEAPYARQVAQFLKTDHHELIVDGKRALEVIPDVIRAYDEPFADFSSIPTYLVSRFARDYVTVALTGDGGDENFGGYNRYRDYVILMNIPVWFRKKVARVASSKIGQKFLSDRFGPYRSEKLAYVMSANGDAELYERLRRLWGARVPTLLNNTTGNINWVEDRARAMMGEDFRFYLPDDLLVKVDRASMAHSLETRAPLLDQRIIEFSRTLATNDLIGKKRGKIILRELLSKYVPSELFERPKAGFMPPVRSWLKEDLRDWGEGLIRSSKLPANLDSAVILQTWNEHQQGKADWTIQLWSVLAFLQWWENRESHK